MGKERSVEVSLSSSKTLVEELIGIGTSHFTRLFIS
jgi:hypothetical protein